MSASNSPLAEISLTDVELGAGRLSVTIVDLERKLNINSANELVLEKAMIEMGVDPGEISWVIAQIKDWVDSDTYRSGRLGGYEDNLYNTLDPPYLSKNAPFDTLEETVHQAAGHAAPGTSVLFSPGCASFELFLNEFGRKEDSLTVDCSASFFKHLQSR